MRREDDRLVGTDDGIDVLEEDNPRQHGMREASLLGFVMVLTKVAGGVKKLLGDNRGLDVDIGALVEDRLVVHADIRLLRRDVIECGTSGVKTAISACEQQSHIGRDANAGIILARGIALYGREGATCTRH